MKLRRAVRHGVSKSFCKKMQKNDEHEQSTLLQTTNMEHTLSFAGLPLPPLVLMLLLLMLSEEMTAAARTGGCDGGS